MTEHLFEELIRSLQYVTDKGETIPLKPTGVQKSGGYTSAFECENPDNGQKYYLKFSDAKERDAEETRTLTKVNQIFKNEALTEPDADKRLGYIPLPRLISNDPARFNPEFGGLINQQRYAIQLQTAATGSQCERELPESLSERISILLALAKLLRTCARNKIAYVDIKPLEHLFWARQDHEIRITLIDWGISRSNAEAVLIIDDIRKFCQYMPEIIYGKKMLDLQYKGKLEYPIQNETRKALIPLLSQFSLNGDLPPLVQEHALVLGDLLSGSANEFRVQNRCISLWDTLINALNTTLTQLQAGVNQEEDSSVLDRLAENALLENKANASKDFTSAMRARQISLASHPAWIIPALRFTQIWFGRIDLVPHSEFDETIRYVLDQEAASAMQEFDKLSDLISQKIAQSETFPELRHRILSNLATIREVINAWCLVRGLDQGTLPSEEFVSELTTSSLRVSDPVLAERYQRVKNGGSQSAQADQAEQIPAIPDAEKEVQDQKTLGLIQAVENLRKEYEQSRNFLLLRNAGFFQRMNEITAAVLSCQSSRPRKLMEPLLGAILSAVDAWTLNIRPEKYFVSDETVNSIDWLNQVSPLICSCTLRLDGKDVQLGNCIKMKLGDTCQALFYTLAREQSSGEPPEIAGKLIQIKTLRKRLDMDNLNYIRALIDRGEFEAANQIINLHYSEFPYLFDQLNNEIAGKRKEQADQKTIAIVNAVLNDLNSGEGKTETARFLNSKQSVDLIKGRFFDFKNRSSQMFELQDDMGRTRSAVSDMRKDQNNIKYLSTGALIAAVLAVVFAIALLTTMLAKNYSLEKNISQLSTSVIQSQGTSQAAAISVQQTLLSHPTDIPTVIPTPLPTHTGQPTEEPIAMIQRIENEEPEITATAEDVISPEDQKLEAMVGKAITFDLAGNLTLFDSDALDTASQLGAVINYAENVSGRMVAYTEKAVNIESEFNIGRSQISTTNNLDVKNATYVRLYSTVAAETTPVFILQKNIKLAKPAADCVSGQQMFCHGVISLWFDRSKIENSLN